MSRTTFNRHRLALEEIFDVEIMCDHSDGYAYYIAETSPMPDASLTGWMADSLAMGIMMADYRSLQSRIALEPIPTAERQLPALLEAMHSNSVTRILYSRIAREPSEYLVEPYALKLFKQRWYLLARVAQRDRLQLFSLERIHAADSLSEHFEMPDGFDVNRYFADLFGVMSAPGIECQRVVVRVFGRDQFYIEELPLHPSQRLMERTDTYSDFELHLKPTSDFAAAILSRGGWAQVIEPQWFAEELLHRAGFMLESFESASE